MKASGIRFPIALSKVVPPKSKVYKRRPVSTTESSWKWKKIDMKRPLFKRSLYKTMAQPRPKKVAKTKNCQVFPGPRAKWLSPGACCARNSLKSLKPICLKNRMSQFPGKTLEIPFKQEEAKRHLVFLQSTLATIQISSPPPGWSGKSL